MPQVPQSTYLRLKPNRTPWACPLPSRTRNPEVPVILRALCSTFMLALRQCKTISCPLRKTQGVKNLRICPQYPRSGCTGPTTALTSPIFKTAYRGSRGQSWQPSQQVHPAFLHAALNPVLHGRGAEDAMRLGLSPSNRSHAGNSGVLAILHGRNGHERVHEALEEGFGWVAQGRSG